MFREEAHLSDQELAMAIDGELPVQRRQHIDSCWACRVRVSQTEKLIADLVQLRHRELKSQIPAIEGPRALLRARLAGLANRNDEKPDGSWVSLALATASVAVLALALLAGVNWMAGGAEAVAKPKRQLTPGATVPLSREDLCREASFAPPSPSPSLKRQIFEEYGIFNARPDAYEVDYLITPELGGATNIRNLWPQPYNTRWNARVKDQLEERLRSMVCRGDIELGTAQQEIATDWISAYKKYFHTDRPLVERPKAFQQRSPPVAQIAAMRRPELRPNRFQIPPMAE